MSEKVPMNQNDSGYNKQYNYPPQQPGYAPLQQGYGQQQQGYAQPPPGYKPGQGYVISPPPPPGAPDNRPHPTMMVASPMSPQGPAPPDYLGQAIMVTLCCFFPTGILAILKANASKSAMMYRDYDEAVTKSKEAKRMINISLFVGIACYVICAIIIGVYFGLIIHNLSNMHDYDD